MGGTAISMPIVSVIIPAYNQDQYLSAAIESVLNGFFQDFEVVIVDEFTGRLSEGRRYSEGLHQALEAKEAVAS